MKYGDEGYEQAESDAAEGEAQAQAEYEATLDLCENCGAEVFEKMIGDESYRTCPNGCAMGN